MQGHFGIVVFKYAEAAFVVWRLGRQEQDYQQQETAPQGRSQPLHW